jgi:hypothetical protein
VTNHRCLIFKISYTKEENGFHGGLMRCEAFRIQMANTPYTPL